VRRWAEEQALAVSAADVDALLDSCSWNQERLNSELDRLGKAQAAHPARTLRRLREKR
jgi:hypothetical protein